MKGSLLVAGVGNIFLGDDGFGVEVAKRLAGYTMPEGVQVADFGVRGMHLAFELLDGYDELILIDAVPRGEEPGTVYVIEPDMTAAAAQIGATPMDAHGMEPATVFTMLHQLGGELQRTLVVGCEPADVSDRIGLSGPVEHAIDEAIRTVQDLLTDRWECAAGTPHQPGSDGSDSPAGQQESEVRRGA